MVVGQLAVPRRFDIEFKFYLREGDPFVSRFVSIHNFALVIEIKPHDARGVRFDNKIASVKYSKGGERTTEKTRKQVFELKKYMARKGVLKIYLQDLIVISGLRETIFPNGRTTALGSIQAEYIWSCLASYQRKHSMLCFHQKGLCCTS